MTDHILPGSSAVPPGLSKTQSCCWTFPRGVDLINSWQLLDDIASVYRYRKAIRAAVERDLLRWACVNSRPVLFECYHGQPIHTFERALVDSWLAAGGRAWIFCELERRSTARVIPFMRGRAQ